MRGDVPRAILDLRLAWMIDKTPLQRLATLHLRIQLVTHSSELSLSRSLWRAATRFDRSSWSIASASLA